MWRHISCKWSHSRIATPSLVVSCLISPTCVKRTFATQYLTKISRNPQFATLSSSDISHFHSILSSNQVIQDADTLATFNKDWMKKYTGQSSLVLLPKTTQQLSAILKYCNERRLAIVPQGGNTGLVGGSVPVFDEIIISMKMMNQIMKFDEYSGIVTCEAGVILQNLNTYLESKGFIVPLDLGAKGTCHIGGNVSTNAGGLRYVRYGSLHGSVLGMEMVLADGTIVDNLSTLRKDNTGYDIKQLFIGAEGTLGFISKLSILTPRKPKCIHVAFLGIKSYENVLKAMQMARTELLEIVSAIEFLDRESMDLVLKHIPNARDPLSDPYPFYMLIETSGAEQEHDQQKINRFLEKSMESELVCDGTLAQDTAQARSLWQLRETITDALAREGVVYKYDISLPVATMYDMVLKMRARLQGAVGGVVGYGHLGDGNLHLNVHTKTFNPQVLKMIEPYLFEQTALERGSVSAEHGLGVSKSSYIGMSKSRECIQIMQQFKQILDPKGIMNPYKLFPQTQ